MKVIANNGAGSFRNSLRAVTQEMLVTRRNGRLEAWDMREGRMEGRSQGYSVPGHR